MVTCPRCTRFPSCKTFQMNFISFEYCYMTVVIFSREHTFGSALPPTGQELVVEAQNRTPKATLSLGTWKVRHTQGQRCDTSSMCQPLYVPSWIEKCKMMSHRRSGNGSVFHVTGTRVKVSLKCYRHNRQGSAYGMRHLDDIRDEGLMSVRRYTGGGVSR